MKCPELQKSGTHDWIRNSNGVIYCYQCKKLMKIIYDDDKHEYEWQRNFKVCKKCGFCGAWLDIR